MKEKNSQLSRPDIVMILPLLDFLLRFLALKGLCHELWQRNKYPPAPVFCLTNLELSHRNLDPLRRKKRGYNPVPGGEGFP